MYVILTLSEVEGEEPLREALDSEAVALPTCSGLGATVVSDIRLRRGILRFAQKDGSWSAFFSGPTPPENRPIVTT